MRSEDSSNDLVGLVHLHDHLGGGVPPHILWEISNQQGINLNRQGEPSTGYREFIDEFLVPEDGTSHNEYTGNKFDWIHNIQSSPAAVERCVMEMASVSYREGGITHLEIRFDPVKRNRNGLYDIDAVIEAAYIGSIRAMATYPITVGLIIEVARSYPISLVKLMVTKIIKHANHNVVGFDISGPYADSFNLDDYVWITKYLHDNGMGVTCHLGEMPGTVDEIKQALGNGMHLDRIGHGIQSYMSPNTMDELAKREICLEICPRSNVMLGAVSNWDTIGVAIYTLMANEVVITINTDGSSLFGSQLKHDMSTLIDMNIITLEQARQLNSNALNNKFA